MSLRRQLLQRLAGPLWRRLPADFRRRLFFELYALGLPHDGVQELEFPLYIAGLFRTPTGLGEAARAQSEGLRLAGIDHVCVDLSGSMSGAATLPDWPGCGVVQPGPGTVIVHGPAPVLSYALHGLGRAKLRHKRLIGYWHWELPALTPLWQSGGRLIDEVWVPTRFVADAVRSGIDRPVRILPFPVPVPADIIAASQTAPAPAIFTVATMFNMSSSFTRKNPLGAIAAFRQAFGDRRDVRLRIKVQNAASYPAGMAAMEDAARAAGNIELVTREMSRTEVFGFLQDSDVVLSLHRAEGLGLLLAEAMALGKPVVSTDYSATAEFVTPDCGFPVPYRLIPAEDPQGLYPVEGQLWAEPDVSAAAAALQTLHADEALRHRLGVQARHVFEQHFGQAAFAQAWARNWR